MSFLENLFLFPIKIMLKILWMLAPFLIIILGVILIVNHPLVILGFTLGFLVAPMFLNKLKIYQTDTTNSLNVILSKKQQLENNKAILHMQLEEITKQYKTEENTIKKQINELNEEISTMDKKYLDILNSKPDKVVYYQPKTFLAWLKTRITTRGR